MIFSTYAGLDARRSKRQGRPTNSWRWHCSSRRSSTSIASFSTSSDQREGEHWTVPHWAALPQVGTDISQNGLVLWECNLRQACIKLIEYRYGFCLLFLDIFWMNKILLDLIYYQNKVYQVNMKCMKCMKILYNTNIKYISGFRN